MPAIRIQVAQTTVHFFVEVDLEKDTVRTLKEKINAKSGGNLPVEAQTLIFVVQLKDELLLKAYNIQETTIVFLLMRKHLISPGVQHITFGGISGIAIL